MLTLRLARNEDLDFLEELEYQCFDRIKRSSRRSLRNSLLSPSQEVYIICEDNIKIAASIIQLYKKTMRIYSISVLPSFQGKSVGTFIMEHIINIARSRGYKRISLEADSDNKILVDWYKKFKFVVVSKIENYYGKNASAYRMCLYFETIDKTNDARRKRNIVVVDTPIDWLHQIESIEVISANQFIEDEKYHTATGVRIFNLCSSYSYQTIGYYVSLLASARDQRVIPNVITIKDFSDTLVVKSIGDEIYELMQKSLNSLNVDKFTFRAYFGQTLEPKYMKLSKALYKLFEAPFLEFQFERLKHWELKDVTTIAPEKMGEVENIVDFAKNYFNQKRFNYTCFKDYKYDLAILIDPDELHPPSCPKALEKFKLAAEKVGFYVDFITKEDYSRIVEYDALLIRTTSNVNDYTYQFSRYAYAEGLVVIDDPWSILRCSNKMYLSERMKKGGILTPNSWLLSNHSSNIEKIELFHYPIVIKKPDSAFSLGVYKVENRVELDKILNILFETSELVIAQEYIQSNYDWRIGILDNIPIFASKYYMAKGHWQIYNWSSENLEESYGEDEAVPIEEVPVEVLKTALKSASFIGDGLYGVDLKEVDDKVYLIEVNDNPNIDFDVEDKILGDKLYSIIMNSFYQRIENSRKVKRFIFN